MQKKVSPGIISVTTSNPSNFRKEWKKVVEARRLDKTEIPVMITEAEGTGFGGTGGVKWVPLIQTPQEMQLIEFRNELRARIESFFGISADIQSGVGEKTQLSEKERKSVEAEQFRINTNLLDKLMPMFGITDWTIHLAPSEESGVFKAEQITQIKLQNAQMWHTLGFEVDKDANGEIRIWKPSLSNEQLGMLTQLIQAKMGLNVQKPQGAGAKPGNTAGGETKMQSYEPKAEKSPTGNPLANKQAELSRGITKEVKDCPLCQVDKPTWEIIRKAVEDNYQVDRNHKHYDIIQYAIAHARKGEVKKDMPLEDWMKKTWPGGAVEKMLLNIDIKTKIVPSDNGKFYWVVYKPDGTLYDDDIADDEDKARDMVSHHMSDLIEELGDVKKADGESGAFQMNRSGRAEGRTNTDINQVQRSGSTYTPGAGGEYNCKFCGKPFKSKEELGGHVRTCSQNPEKNPMASGEGQPGMEAEASKFKMLLNALLASLANSHKPTAMTSPPKS